MQVCPLTDPDIGPVSDNDHKLGLCMCSRCTCGSHVCPFPRFSLKRNPRSVYKSTYRSQFRSQRASKSIPVIRQGQLSIVKAKMDLETVSRSYYKPYELQHSVLERPSTSKPSMKFLARSNYSINYPDWGPVEALDNSPQRVFRSSELKFNSKSTYAAEFTGRSPESQSHSIVHQQTKGLLDMSYEHKFRSTAQSHFRSASTNLKGPSYETSKPSLQYEAPEVMYQSEARREYRRQRYFKG